MSDTGWVYVPVWDAAELRQAPGFEEFAGAIATRHAEKMGAEIVGPMEIASADQFGRDVLRWPIRRIGS